MSNLTPLAQNIYLRKNNNSPVLLLGAGCSVNSNCPSTKELISKLIEANNLSHLSPEENSLSDIEKELQKSILNLNLKEYFSNSNPSYGYWALAELIKKGYFNLILTTNFDTCLEKILSKVLNVDDFRVFIRGDIEDRRIIDLLDNNPYPKIKIIKLHGDYLSQNALVKPEAIWNFDDKLDDILKKEIEKRGILFIGSSLQEKAILRILPKSNKLPKISWYVSHSALSKNDRNDLGGFENIIDGEKEGDFDKFLLQLSKEIIEKEQNEFLVKLKKGFNKDFHLIVSSLSPVIDPDNVSQKILDLGNKIKKRFIGENNLVFIHDPDCPGGSEVLKVLNENCSDWLGTQCVYIIEIEGRDKKLSERKALKLNDIKNNEIKQFESIKKDIRFVLIDSVSFTGGTITLCKNKLVEIFGPDITVGAAVIFSGPEQEQKLEDRIFCIGKDYFCKLESIKSYHILFPWGYTSSTAPVKAYKKEITGPIDIFLPSHKFSFLPRLWGKINSLVENELVSVKLLYLNSSERTSKHKHYFRDEIFYILDNYLELQVSDQYIPLRKGDFICVPAGIEHRHIALNVPCWILEISYNYCDQKNDIYRVDDKYNRPKEDGDV
jgi:mannose-6-phosphate isomerase-like protein (cupin superfamily)/NAD-dependent SIR2 family protein deacetylase